MRESPISRPMVLYHVVWVPKYGRVIFGATWDWENRSGTMSAAAWS